MEILQKCDKASSVRLAFKSAICAAPALALAMPARAGEPAQDQQLWLQANINAKLGGGWTLSEEFNTRFANAKNGLYEIESNLLLGYRLSKKVTIAAGYTHDPQYIGGHFAVLERRAREQVGVDNVGTLLSGSVSLRLRTEQRWRDGVAGTGWRLRPYLKYSLPLAKDVALVLWDESFINLNSTVFQTQTGFDRMRNNATIRFPLSKRLSGEVGYLNQYTVVRGGQDKMDSAATVAISLSL